jgi:hypothetical protein
MKREEGSLEAGGHVLAVAVNLDGTDAIDYYQPYLDHSQALHVTISSVHFE